MDRLQKKCLIATALLHGLLLLVTVVGTAFFTAKDKPSVEPAHIIELIPLGAKVTDGPTRGGGGNPAPPTSAPEPVKEIKPAQLPPPAPAAKPEPQKEVEPPKKAEPKETVSEIPVPKKEVKSKPVPKEVVKPATTRKFDISKPVVRNTRDKVAEATAEKAERAAQLHAQAQRLAAVKGALKNIGSKLSSPTTMDSMPGQGGGEAAINYADLVLTKYDQAWFAPDEVDSNEAVVKAKVVIARSGNVVSAVIVRASGNPILDKSVRRALELRFIERFPSGSTDSQRTFIINFNLKSKRGIG